MPIQVSVVHNVREDMARRDATNITEQSHHGMVVLLGIDTSIGYD